MPRRIAIVGAGPYCTYALERLAAHLTDTRPYDLDIAIFERTGRFGAGATHSDEQVRTSFMNRVASQIAFAADESNEGAGPLLPSALRPTFAQWSGRRYEETADERYAVRPDEIPRRYLHGEALREAFDRYVALLRAIPQVTVSLHVADVVDVVPAGDAFRVDVAGPQPWSLQAERVLFVTGHSENRPAPASLSAKLAEHAGGHAPARFVPSAYPLAERVTEDAVPAGCSAVVLGLGLTAIDVLLHLTEGRGGRFVADDAAPWRVRYVPSGREPRTIIATSPSGMFPACRPHNAKAADPTGAAHSSLVHSGTFLTVDAVRALRRSRGTPVLLRDEIVRSLDFDRDVLPLLVLELAHVYYATLLGARFGEALRHAVEERYREFLAGGAPIPDGVNFLLEPLQERFDDAAAYLRSTLEGTPLPDRACQFAEMGLLEAFHRTVYGEQGDRPSPWGHSGEIADHRFDWRHLFEPLTAVDAASGERWRTALIEYMRRDHAFAAQGNLRNPVKAATDSVWRDLRAVLSEAVDRGGLTAESHRRFMQVTLRTYTRMSNGIGLEAMSKILALVEHGIIDVGIGPGGNVEPVPGLPQYRVHGRLTGAIREADVVIEGRAHPFDPEHDVAPLYRRMIERGMVRRWHAPGASPGEDFVPGGLDLSAEFHPVGADGTVDHRLTILGAPAETVWFFQLSAARPCSGSTVLDNAARWARETAAAFAPVRAPSAMRLATP